MFRFEKNYNFKTRNKFSILSYILLPNQVILYLLAGGLTFCIDFGIYQILLFTKVNITVSKGLSFICALVASFNLNRNIVFKYRYSDYEFQRFLILAGLNLIVNISINKISLIFFGPNSINICFIVATIITVTCSFCGQKLWVFKKGMK